MERREPVGKAESGKAPLGKPLSLLVIHGSVTADPSASMKKDDPRQG